jgi:hypothetical protein
MKKGLTLIVLLILNALDLSAQDSIYVTPTGFTTVHVQTVLDDNTLYSRAIEWVNEVYKNPDKVITGKIPGVSLNISGYSAYAWNYSSMGMDLFYSMTYNLYITIDRGKVVFKMVEGEFRQSGGGQYLGDSKSFFNNKGEYRKIYNTAKSTLENSINELWLSFYAKIMVGQLSSNEALDQLKKAKEKLDLELITREEYEVIKAQLAPFIK